MENVKQSWEERSMNFEGGKCKAKSFDYWAKDNNFLQLGDFYFFNKWKKRKIWDFLETLKFF